MGVFWRRGFLEHYGLWLLVAIVGRLTFISSHLRNSSALLVIYFCVLPVCVCFAGVLSSFFLNVWERFLVGDAKTGVLSLLSVFVHLPLVIRLPFIVEVSLLACWV